MPACSRRPPRSTTSTVGPGTQQRATVYPDLVGNLRVDQAWGSAQIMGALHDASGQYLSCQHQRVPSASNIVGGAVGAGVKILTPFIGAGDYFQAEVNYTQGATGYTNAAPGDYAKFNGGIGGTYGGGVLERQRH